MAHVTRPTTCGQVPALRDRFAPRDTSPFADVLPESRVAQALRGHDGGWRDEVFSPALTLWAFLTRVICPVGCCRRAVARVTAGRVSRGHQPGGPGTGGYGKARARLPEGAITQLARQAGRVRHDRAPDEWLWQGRRVRIADGATVGMPEPTGNPKAYPHPGSQADGIGFPQVWAHLLAYNLCRAAMARVARASERQPREMSVSGPVQASAAFAEVLGTDSGYQAFVRVVLAYRVGNRPDRVEPRARTRRPKPYPLRTVPRHEARKRLGDSA